MPELIKIRLSIRFPRDPHVSARIVTPVLGPEFPEVMRAAVHGDETAFARLWRDNQPPLLRYLRVVTGESAEDVASEVWLETSRRLARFHPSQRGDIATKGAGCRARAGRTRSHPRARPRASPRETPAPTQK